MINNWKHIDSAPKNGTVILTNEGTARYVDQKHWGSPVTNGWYLCTTKQLSTQTNYQTHQNLMT